MATLRSVRKTLTRCGEAELACQCDTLLQGISRGKYTREQIKGAIRDMMTEIEIAHYATKKEGLLR